MECSQIPAADRWDEASSWQLRQYRSHVAVCRSCRQRVLKVAPDQLLFELGSQDMPQNFWLGFWQSLRKKLTYAPSSPVARPSSLPRVFRWATVFITVLLFMSQGLDVPDISQNISTPKPKIAFQGNDEYPLIEEVQSPTATYYIFQPAKDEKIVMVFDPEMEL